MSMRGDKSKVHIDADELDDPDPAAASRTRTAEPWEAKRVS